MLWKCCTQYASKFGKLSSGHRTGKGQSSFQPQRKAMPKNAQTTTQLISHASKVMVKIFQARLQQDMNCELPDVQAEFRKGRGTRDQIANIHWIIEKAREFQKNIYFCFIEYAKAFDCVAAAKSLQSCPTLCDPIDGNPPGFPVPGFFRQEHWSGLPFPSPMQESEKWKWKWSRSVVSDS